MRVLTFKAKPKMIFGLVMALTGIIVIVLTFVGNHSGAAEQAVMAEVSCKTTEERVSYLESLGWKTDGTESNKQVIIPSAFNDVYNDYNEIQKQQGFDLEEHKGKQVEFYTYNICNYGSNDNVVADLMVLDGALIGADLCDTSADSGFLVALTENSNGKN